MGISEFHKSRRQKYLGASEIASVLGVNPFQNAYDLWLLKTGRAAPFEGNQATDFGNRFEPVILDWASEQIQAKIRRNVWRVHKDTGVLSATLDAAVLDKPWAIEAKSSGLKSGRADEGFGEPGTDDVPERILVQAQHQALVADLETIWVPALLNRGHGMDFYLYRVDRNEELCQIILERGMAFWEGNVLADIPPTGETPSLETVKRLYREPESSTDLPDEVVEAWLQAKEAEKAAVEARKEAEATMLAALGDAEAGLCSSYQITYLQQSRANLDTKRLKTEHPELYAEYAKESTYRVLRKKALAREEAA